MLITALEQQNYQLNIESNTLEEAFISLAEDKSKSASLQEIELRERVMEKLFAKSYKQT